jgi:hypothetical protein
MDAWEIGGPPPVEYRLFGLDKRLILPTLAILAVVIFWGGVVPAIDEAMDGDEFAPGTVLMLRGGVEFTPAAGWIPDGVPAPSNPAVTIFSDGVTFTISTGAFEGTPRELLDEIASSYSEFDTEGEPRTLSLNQGIPGIGTNIYGVDFSGVLFAFVADTAEDGRDTGIRVVVEGPLDIVPDDRVQDVAEMLASIRVDFEGANQ